MRLPGNPTPPNPKSTQPYPNEDRINKIALSRRFF
jgi:hypothetical protein